jgi:hypothetical protein
MTEMLPVLPFDADQARGRRRQPDPAHAVPEAIVCKVVRLDPVTRVYNGRGAATAFKGQKPCVY